jgi:hypothetical protein
VTGMSESALPGKNGAPFIDSLTESTYTLEHGWSGGLGRCLERLACLRGARTALGAPVIL